MLLHVNCDVIAGTVFSGRSAELRIYTFPGASPAYERFVFCYRHRSCFIMTTLHSSSPRPNPDATVVSQKETIDTTIWACLQRSGPSHSHLVSCFAIPFGTPFYKNHTESLDHQCLPHFSRILMLTWAQAVQTFSCLETFFHAFKLTLQTP
jgi:hypothetical protein